MGKTAVVAIRQSFSEPPTLVRLDPRSGKAGALTHFNDAALGRQRARQGRERHLHAAPAVRHIQMWVVYPPDFDPAKKYPVYMLLHGGPHNAMTDADAVALERAGVRELGIHRDLAQFPRLERLRAGVHRFDQSGSGSTLPYEDTIKAARWLMAQPYVDRERMAAGGGSYGGFLASTLLGREHPFKTLIAHAAVYDQYTQIGSGLRRGEAPLQLFLGEARGICAQSHPHTFAGNFNTPTLVIHGQLDMRVPVNHGIELFNILQSKGVPSRLVYFPDENHWVLKPQNSLFWYRTVREWLAQYVPPGGHASPTAAAR